MTYPSAAYFRAYRARRRAKGLCAYTGCYTPTETYFCLVHQAKKNLKKREAIRSFNARALGNHLGKMAVGL